MKRWKKWLPVPVILAAVVFLAIAVPVQANNGDGWLGVYIQNVDEEIADAEGLDKAEGVYITRVIKDSPAEEAGLERGDIVIMFDGKNARSVRRLTRLIDWSEPGEKMSVVILRDGDEKTITVVIGEDDDDNNVFFYGGEDFHFEVPDIDIRIPNVPRIPHAPQVYSFSTGHLSTSHIGVSLHALSKQLADHYDVDGGALINEVVDDSPAEKAGLQAGDVIVEVDGDEVDDISDIREAIQEKDEDETVEVTVVRSGSRKTFDVEIETSETWSGIGLPRFEVRSRATRNLFFDRHDDHDRARNSYRGAMRKFRESGREWRDEWNNEWRDELREAMEELREELEDMRDDLQEQLKEIDEGF